MNVKLGIERNGRLYKYPVTLAVRDGLIWFEESPFELKDELKALKGARWHGMEDPPIMKWSALDCERNRFQLQYLQRLNPYAWWDRPIEYHEYARVLRDHQRVMADHMLTYHYGILAAEMGLGKTLAAIEIMERSGQLDWWWVGPKSAIRAVELEFKKWEARVMPTLMTYEGLTKIMKTWTPGDPAPQGVVFDESSRLKTATAQRSRAAQALSDAIRAEYGKEGYVVLMSGTPSPKSPLDWWSQCEIAWPGFVREGSPKTFEWRLSLMEKQKKPDGFFWHRITWLDNEEKCAICGGLVELPPPPEDDDDYIPPPLCKCSSHTPSINEVAYLDQRLKGLALPFLKKDCLDLPEKQYREIRCEPTRTIKRVAESLAELAPTAIQALTWLRELSDGFQYVETEACREACVCTCGGPGPTGAGGCEPDSDCDICGGSGGVPVMVRGTKMIPCPKDQVVKDLLEECEDQGRIVIFAGFTGSIDRVRELCLSQKWDVVQVDGRGWKIFGPDKDYCRNTKALEHWSGDAKRVVFLAHPQSGGLGLTLTESRMAVYYSNDFNPESRSQSEDRIHRMGMDTNRGATIVDIYHLPSDEHVRNVLKNNRRLELMTLGEVQETL